MTEAKTVAKGSFWTLFFTMISKFLSFIYTVILARFIAPDDVGAFYLVLSVLGILYIFTDLGIIYSLNRYVPYLYGRKEIGRLRSLIKLTYVGGGILTLVFSVAVFFLAGFIAEFVGQPTIAPILQVLCIWLFIKEIEDVNLGVLSGRKKMMESQGLDALKVFIKLVLTIGAFYIIGFNMEALEAGFLIPFIFVVPLGIYLVYRELRTWKKEEKTYTVREQLSFGKEVVWFGIVITLINTISTLFRYTDRVMIGYFTENALTNVAVYTMATGLAFLVLIFPAAIGGIFFPVVSELYGKRDFEGINKIMRTSMKWLVMITVPLTLILSIFSSELLLIIYGAEYAAGAAVLVLFVVGLFIRSLFYLPSNILASMNRLDVEFKSIAVATLLNVGLNFLFIPVWGINGAGLASLISFIALSIMLYYYSRKLFGFKFPREVYKPIIAGILAFVMIFLLKGTILALINAYVPSVQADLFGEQIANEIVQKLVKFVIFGLLFLVACFVYFILLFALKTFGAEELDILEAAMRKARVPDRYIAFTRAFFEARWLPFHK